jgi:hypothetical protein
MMSPHHLHATAAAWSLRAALDRLLELAAAEARQTALERLTPACGLRSTVYGVRYGSGSHSDPVSGLLLAADHPPHTTRWAEIGDRLHGRLEWPAPMLRNYGVRDPLAGILAALPGTLPGTAAVVAKHLADEDTWVRNTIALPPAQHPLIGIGCPSCGQRSLHVQSAGPQEAWTVVCTAGCVCTGQGCGCGMPGAVEGVAHIWPRSVVLGAVAGAATAA